MMEMGFEQAVAVDAGDALCAPITDAVLAEITRRIVTRCPDARVILFGSRARGDANEASDVDLLVITPSAPDSTAAFATELYLAIGERLFGIDLVVMSPDRLQRRLAGFDPFLEEALLQGRVLHEPGA